MDVEIRHVRPGDEGLFTAVAPEVFDDDIDPALLGVYLTKDQHVMVVALAGGQVVGQARAIIHFHPDEAPELYVDNLGVTPGLQRQGIARCLMDRLYTIGQESGCAETWVLTETDNHRARALYASYGAELAKPVMYARSI